MIIVLGYLKKSLYLADTHIEIFADEIMWCLEFLSK